MAKVVLIGGPPGAGKTTLSQRLAARLGFVSLTIDDVATGIRAVTTQTSHPAFHLMPEGHVAYFTNGPAEKLIADAQALEHAIWPAVERLIRARLQGDYGIVIDWWLLPPRQVAAFGSDDVCSLWLHIDPDVLDQRERANDTFRDGSDDADRMHHNYMARSLWRNDLIVDEARNLGLALLHQRGQTSRDQLVEEAISKLA